MTGMEPPAPGPSDDPQPQKTPAIPENPARGEVLVDGSAVIASFFLPELEPQDLDFRVGARTLSVWSKRASVEFRTIVILPAWVNSDQFVFTHKNGVYEFLMEAVPGLAA